MMKRTMWMACILLWGVLPMKAQDVVVIGEVQGVKEGTEFFLEETTGTGSVMRFYRGFPEDNGILKDGRFVLRYKCRRPDSRNFNLWTSVLGSNDKVELEFWANQGDTVYVKGKGPILANWEVRTKAPEQKELDAIRRVSAKERASYQQAHLDYEAYRNYRRDAEMSEAEWDSTGVILKQKEELVGKAKMAWYKKELEVMKSMPVTDFWMDRLGTIVSWANFHRAEFADVIKELYVQKSEQIDRKPDGKTLREWVYPYAKAELGKACVDGEMFDLNGKKHHLKDFRGKYILLDFWANYCGPCVDAFPEIAKLQKKYEDRLVVISLSVDKVNYWEGSRYHKEITWCNFNDGGGHDGGLAGSYDVTGTPTYILIAPDGTYKAKMRSVAMYDGTIEKYLTGEL